MKYGVKDLARLLGLTPSAIHFLEKEDLITAEKDNRGYRYYRAIDVLRFLSYSKYRAMGFTMKSVIKQFNGEESDWHLVFSKLEKQKIEARRKAKYYSELEASIDEHISSTAQIKHLLDNYEFSKSPPITALSKLEGGWAPEDQDNQKIAQKWVAAMPATRLIIILDSVQEMKVSFGYAAHPDKACELGLPMDKHIENIPGMSCIHTVVAVEGNFMENPQVIFERPLNYARSRGFELTGKPWGYMLLVEASPGEVRTAYIELWIPVR